MPAARSGGDRSRRPKPPAARSSCRQVPVWDGGPFTSTLKTILLARCVLRNKKIIAHILE